MNIKDTFVKYIEEAIGHENALVAFSAFEEPASTAVRYNPFKPCGMMEGRRVPWAEHGYVLPERPVFTLDPLFHAGRCLWDMPSERCFLKFSCRKDAL